VKRSNERFAFDRARDAACDQTPVAAAVLLANGEYDRFVVVSAVEIR
jgi:hypothetical protein